jgi:hypothetical protein
MRILIETGNSAISCACRTISALPLAMPFVSIFLSEHLFILFFCTSDQFGIRQQSATIPIRHHPLCNELCSNGASFRCMYITSFTYPLWTATVNVNSIAVAVQIRRLQLQFAHSQSSNHHVLANFLSRETEFCSALCCKLNYERPVS